jgi:GNAT superfamily N-acetyltransferase
MTEIRLASAADLPGILEVGRVTWPPTYTPLAGERYVQQGLALLWTEAGTMPSIADGRVWVADDLGTIAGMAMYGIEDDVVDLWKLYVRPERQGEGLGSALLSHVVAATRGSADRVTLAYMDGNTSARRFYEHHGFVETHREVDQLGGPGNVWMVLSPQPVD